MIANRIRRNTLTYQSLIRFLQTLGIPIVATIRDSQNYVRAAELGVGVHEMKSYVAAEDVEQWVPLTDWLAQPRRQHVSSSHGVPAPGAAAASAAQPNAAVHSMTPAPRDPLEETSPLPAVAGFE